MAQISITNETRASMPRASFAQIADEVLGKDYKLNLVFVGPGKMKKLNLTYRNKNISTDILSFPLSKNEGEIYICPSESKKEAKKFDRSFENFIPFLFIHGCVHLKGHDHGSTMERIEAKIREKFQV